MIAPAGHGKTTAIADCLLQCSKETCHLILTHTHAGVAALRTKFKNRNVPMQKYQIETIMGFAQQLVLSFIGSSQLPKENDNDFFSQIIYHCTSLLKSNAIQLILKKSYASIFVDEYQDCTINQHHMILQLGNALPLHLLGDPLQGIFSFERTPLVNFETDLKDFSIFNTLNHPWRWEYTNKKLGENILTLRESLEDNNPIDLTKIQCEGLIIKQYKSLMNIHDNKFLCLLRTIIKENIDNSFLIIYPSFHEKKKDGKTILRGTLSDRIALKAAIDFGYGFNLIDAIDSKSFYTSASKIDEYIKKCQDGNRINRIQWLYDIMVDMHFSKTEMNIWINRDKNSLIKKKKDKVLIGNQIKCLIEKYDNQPCLSSLMFFLEYMYDLTSKKCLYKDIYYEIRNSAKTAICENIPLQKAVRQHKNQIRHIGRRIEGRCIGTTLLTKGLEFDTVLLFNADKFEDKKNFYVAISRARKKLIILTNKNMVQF